VTPTEVRRLEQAIEKLAIELRNEIAHLRVDVKRASNFQLGFQVVSKSLTYVLGVVAAIAVIYGALR
jgi:hypothetical protein